jgi:4-amino-4-deoxy-L-arabinose transferase-like glycosyltransferase
VQLAAHRAEELLPVLNRADVLTPLVVLLAILPGLFALEHRTLDDAGALWGLKSLDRFTVSRVEEVVHPKQTSPADVLKWQPPLGSWLTAAVMSIVGPSQTIALVVVSYLSTVALVIVMFFLCRHLAGPRFAFWATLLLACHGPLLAQAQNPAPHSLALLLALCTFWGFLSHLHTTNSLVSVKLLLGGIAAGMCLLAGGPLVLVVLATLLLYGLGLRRSSLNDSRSLPSVRDRIRGVWPAFISWLLLGLTAFAVGGWWVLMMISEQGFPFWTGWITGAVPGPNAQAAGLVRGNSEIFAAEHFLAMLGVLTGLSVLGIWRACREVFDSADETRRRSLMFLIAWAGCALLVWLRVQTAVAHVAELWQGFLLLPCIALAAFAIVEISQRRVHILVVVGMTAAVPATMVAYSLLDAPHDGGNAGMIGFITLIIVLFALVGWWFHHYGRDQDPRQRVILSGLIVAHVLANAAVGLWSVRLDRDDERSLAAFREGLASITNVETCTLISDGDQPARLQFMLRSLWPAANLNLTGSWDAALSQALSEQFEHGGILLVVDWSARNTRPTNLQIQGLQVSPYSSPSLQQYFRSRQLLAYAVTKHGR